MATIMVLCLVFLSACTQVSSPGVTVINSGLVALPQGPTLIMRHQSGKTSQYWQVTYDGEELKLHSNDSFFDDDKSVILRSDKHVEITFGWLSESLEAWTDGEVAYVSFNGGFWGSWTAMF